MRPYNPIESKLKKKYEVKFSINLMLNDEVEKKSVKKE